MSYRVIQTEGHSPTDWTKETVTVTSAAFGEAAVAGRFTLAGLGLRPGTNILDNDHNRQGRWDGSGVNYARERQPSVVKTQPAPPAGGLNFWMVAACVLLAVVAAVVFYRLFVARSR